MDNTDEALIGYLYAAKAPGASILKIGKTRNDPGTYVARRYAYYLEMTNLLRVFNVDMAEKVVHHRLKHMRADRGGGNEVFHDMDWTVVQREFEFAACLCKDDALLNDYCDSNNIQQLSRGMSRMNPRYERVGYLDD
jgi:hypothetical protein